MPNFISILTNLVTEASRYKMDPELNLHLHDLADRLWNKRNKKFKKRTLVDKILFKTSDGVDGMVKVFINPKLKFIANMQTEPEASRDPMDFVMEVQPEEYVSKKNLYLTLYHELLHATDPSQSTKYSEKYMLSYDEEDDSKYWGHPIEFRTIANEFLEGLELEIERRIHSFRNPESVKYILRSLDNILNYFSKGEDLNNYSLDILKKINDENVMDNMASDFMSNLISRFPSITDFVVKKSEDEPYYITYIELIKQNNPDIWPRFLTMLYKSVNDLKERIKKGLI